MSGWHRTEAETAGIVERLLHDAAPEGLAVEELEKIVGWIDQARLDSYLLQLFDEGKIKIRWLDGQPAFWAKRER